MAQISDGFVLRHATSSPIAPQFSTVGTDIASVATTPIHYKDHDGNLLNQLATGFTFRHLGRPWLVTALHCLTGRNVFTGKPINAQTGFEPLEILAYPNREAHGGLTRWKDNISLYDDAGTANFFIDPFFDEFRTDIGVIPLNESAYPVRCINLHPADDLLACVGSDCFVVGYPLSSIDDPFFPVWRRGSFAYEPSSPVDGKPIFLIDAATSSGMSGSPLIQRWSGPAPIQGANGRVEVAVDRVISSALCGVYGGRAHSADNVGPIGYGWYSNRITLIIEGAVRYDRAIFRSG